MLFGLDKRGLSEMHPVHFTEPSLQNIRRSCHPGAPLGDAGSPGYRDRNELSLYKNKFAYVSPERGDMSVAIEMKTKLKAP